MFVISWFTSRNGVCKLKGNKSWVFITVTWSFYLNFLCKLVLLVNSASLFYLVSFRVSGMPRINKFIIWPFFFSHQRNTNASVNSTCAQPPAPPPGWPPGIGIFFALDGKFPGVGTLELSNPPGCGRVFYYKLLKPTWMLRGAFTEKCALDFIDCKL